MAAISDFFHQNDFVHIQTPVLTSTDCEGAGETVTVTPSTLSGPRPPGDGLFFDRKTFLSVSGQLHLEAAVG